MVYLDYSATTPVNLEVLDCYNEICKKYIGNYNSLHNLGIESRKLVEQATKQISKILKIKEAEIIYTSGASEANNMALKGICFKYKNRGKHIITTKLEHPSVIAPISYLTKLGFEVDFVNLLNNGQVDLNHLKKIMTDKTILVSIGEVNSEIGIVQPISEIGKIIKEYPKCFFHVDMTQSLGKKEIDLTNVDLASFSAHKIYGLKGIGFLYKKDKIEIEPLIHGGDSQSSYRGGTPPVALIGSFAKAIRLANDKLKSNIKIVKNINKKVVSTLKKEYPNIHINSNDICLPQIINISLPNIKSETFQRALEAYDIYISTQTACSSKIEKSIAVLILTKNEQYAKSSIRISLSHLTTNEEIDYFLKMFKKCYERLR